MRAAPTPDAQQRQVTAIMCLFKYVYRRGNRYVRRKRCVRPRPLTRSSVRLQQ